MSIVSSAYCLPVLKYHGLVEGVLPKGAHPVHVNVDSFIQQLQWLQQAGYSSVPLSTLRTGKPPQGVDPNKCFAITFDGGFLSQLKLAYPVLESFGFKATVFVVTHWLDEVVEHPNLLVQKLPEDHFMQWTDVGFLFENGWAVGSQGVAHLDSTTIDEDRLELEMRYSQEAIKAYTGRAPVAFAYPFGKFDDRAIEMTRKYYPQAYSNQPGLSSMRPGYRYRQHRIEINQFDDLASFQRKVTRGYGQSNTKFKRALLEQAELTKQVGKAVKAATTSTLRNIIP